MPTANLNPSLLEQYSVMVTSHGHTRTYSYTRRIPSLISFYWRNKLDLRLRHTLGSRQNQVTPRTCSIVVRHWSCYSRSHNNRVYMSLLTLLLQMFCGILVAMVQMSSVSSHEGLLFIYTRLSLSC